MLSSRELRNIATQILEMNMYKNISENMEELINNANDAVRDLANAIEKEKYYLVTYEDYADDGRC